MPDNDHAPADSRFRTLSAGGVKLRVYTRHLGRPGVPLVICNGLGQSIEILYPLIEQFRDRPVISFDAAGAGRSEVPVEITTIPRHAHMLREILDQLGVGQADVMGISWGGAVAQQIARDDPDRVRKLILAITSAGGIGSWWGSPVAISEIMFPLRYVNKTYGNFIGPWMYGGEAILQPALFRDYAKHAVAPDFKGYFAQVTALCSWTSIPWLGQLRQPTQIIGGALDTLIPIANQMLLASLMPRAAFKIYNAGHLLMYSRRTEVGARVTDFLDR